MTRVAMMILVGLFCGFAMVSVQLSLLRSGYPPPPSKCAQSIQRRYFKSRLGSGRIEDFWRVGGRFARTGNYPCQVSWLSSSGGPVSFYTREAELRVVPGRIQKEGGRQCGVPPSLVVDRVSANCGVDVAGRSGVDGV